MSWHAQTKYRANILATKCFVFRCICRQWPISTKTNVILWWKQSNSMGEKILLHYCPFGPFGPFGPDGPDGPDGWRNNNDQSFGKCFIVGISNRFCINVALTRYTIQKSISPSDAKHYRFVVIAHFWLEFSIFTQNFFLFFFVCVYGNSSNGRHLVKYCSMNDSIGMKNVLLVKSRYVSGTQLLAKIKPNRLPMWNVIVEQKWTCNDKRKIPNSLRKMDFIHTHYRWERAINGTLSHDISIRTRFMIGIWLRANRIFKWFLL